MTRPVKKPLDATRKQIYGLLDGRKLRFNEILRESGKDRVTLAQCLRYGKEQGEIEHDSRGSPYSVTAKGQDELGKLEIARQMREQPIRYDEELDFFDELSELPDDPEMACAMLDHPLLPVRVRATIYGSEPTTLDNLKWRVLAGNPDLGPRKVATRMLKALTRAGLASVWDAILSRVWMLMEQHRAYNGRGAWTGATADLVPCDRRRGRPPPLNLENILGFDQSLTIRYEGRKLMRSEETEALIEKHHLDKRLVGSLLLQIVEIEGVAPKYREPGLATRGHRLWNQGRPSYYDMIPLLEDSGLVEKADVEEIRHGRILEVALRYLKEGGVPKMRPDRLAKKFISRRKRQPPRPYIIPRFYNT